VSHSIARLVKVAATLAVLTAVLWLLHPWTVRPINGAAVDAGDPSAAVDRLWADRLVPALVASAADAGTVVEALRSSPDGARAKFGRSDGSGGWYVTLRGRGRILSIDTTSATGLAAIDVLPYDGRADLTLQIGPVIRGSAVRDATDLVPFSQFPNQLAYADAANTLNARVAKDVLGPVSPLAKGQVVSFVAAGGTTAADSRQLDSLVPVQLSIEPPGRD
jgi:predicted lipoprotein